MRLLRAEYGVVFAFGCPRISVFVGIDPAKSPGLGTGIFNDCSILCFFAKLLGSVESGRAATVFSFDKSITSLLLANEHRIGLSGARQGERWPRRSFRQVASDSCIEAFASLLNVCDWQHAHVIRFTGFPLGDFPDLGLMFSLGGSECAAEGEWSCDVEEVLLWQLSGSRSLRCSSLTLFAFLFGHKLFPIFPNWNGDWDGDWHGEGDWNRVRNHEGVRRHEGVGKRGHGHTIGRGKWAWHGKHACSGMVPQTPKEVGSEKGHGRDGVGHRNRLDRGREGLPLSRGLAKWGIPPCSGNAGRWTQLGVFTGPWHMSISILGPRRHHDSTVQLRAPRRPHLVVWWCTNMYAFDVVVWMVWGVKDAAVAAAVAGAWWTETVWRRWTGQWRMQCVATRSKRLRPCAGFPTRWLLCLPLYSQIFANVRFYFHSDSRVHPKVHGCVVSRWTISCARTTFGVGIRPEFGGDEDLLVAGRGRNDASVHLCKVLLCLATEDVHLVLVETFVATELQLLVSVLEVDIAERVTHVSTPVTHLVALEERTAPVREAHFAAECPRLCSAVDRFEGFCCSFLTPGAGHLVATRGIIVCR